MSSRARLGAAPSSVASSLEEGHPQGSAEEKAAEKAEGDRINKEIFYTGNELLGMSGHELQRTHGTTRDLWGNPLEMSPAPISAGLIAHCWLHGLGFSHARAKPGFS